MKYSVNPSALGSMLAIPSVVAEKHLKLASGNQLRVLLAFFKFMSGDDYIEKISEVTSLKAAEIIDCLDYWTDCSVLVTDSKSRQISDAENESEKSAAKSRSVHTVSGKPTREEAVSRASGDEQLRFLFDEVQKKLSKQITVAQMSTLIWLHDTHGLPVEVILMAVEYSVSEGKPNFSYIEKVCVDWAENDVCDVAAAEKRLNQLYLTKSAWKFVRSAFGIEDRRPSKKENEYSDKWVNSFGFTKSMLKAAYDICIDSTGKMSFPYINKILEKWHKDGVKRVEDINKSSSKTSDGGKDGAKSGTSYDIDKINSTFNDFDSLGW